MKYCEVCRAVGEFDVCPVCANKNTREPQKDDYCFFMERDQNFAELLDGFLKEEGIPVILMPSGNGFRTFLGLTLENYKMFVPFGFFDQAKDIAIALLNEPIDRLRKTLLENFDAWHFKKDSGAKKMRKKLKLAKDADVLGCIKALVSEADLISDKGAIYSVSDGAHYIGVETENGTVLFNSVTFEIYS